MDLDYLVQHPETIDRLIEHQRIRITTIGGGSGWVTQRLTLDDGTDLFAKSQTETSLSATAFESGQQSPLEQSDPARSLDTTQMEPQAVGLELSELFRAEASGLQWLAEAKAVPVPRPVAATSHTLAVEWIPPGAPSAQGAHRLGRELAALHQYGAAQFGRDSPGFVGGLPLDNRRSDHWAEFYVENRCLPYLRRAVDAEVLDASEARRIDRALATVPERAGPAEPPARIHGDLWPGNVHYAADGRAWLVDAAAAHGGHRETDLATLRLWGATPYFDEVLAGYQEVSPLSDGWQDRIGLHQTHLLLVHCVLFGRSYVPSVLAALRA